MATKPLTQPEYWATDATYTTGPFIGQPQKVVPPGAFAAEGHRPGALFPTPAEYENSQQYNLTGLVRWLFLGTSNPDPDAHVVETDSTGRAGLHGLDVIDTVDETALNVTAVSTVAPGAFFSNVSGGSAIAANTGNTNASCIGASTGNLAGDCFSATLTGTQSGGSGYRVVTDAATGASGVLVTHIGSGIGVEVNQSGSGDGIAVVASGAGAGLTIAATGAGRGAEVEADNEAAIYAEGGVAGSASVLALGKTTAVGVRGSGGPGGANGVEGVGTGTSSSGVAGIASQYGVSGAATDTTDGFGVLGTSATLATVQAGGVMGEGKADGTGVFGVADDGYGGLFTANGTRPTVFLSSRGSDPTSTVTGGIWNRSSRGLSTFVANIARLIWHTAGGAAIAWDVDLTGGVVTDAPTTILSCTLTAADSPVVAGTVWILVTLEVGRNSGTPNLNIEIGDATDPFYPIPATTVVQLFQTGGATVYERTLAYVVPYALPATGSRTFTVTINSTVVGNNINYRHAGLGVIGVF